MGSKIWRMLMWPCQWCLSGFLSLLHIELSDKLWSTVEQFIKFACVGCFNTIILLAVYYIVIFIFGESAYLLGQTFGYVTGIVNSYFWNSKIVFHADIAAKPRKAFVRMCMCYGITYVVQIGILFAGVEMLHISERIVPIIAIMVTTPVNYLLNRSFAFENKIRGKRKTS
ncbi:MAG: GtrA family protein [Lachnospiraceae bacterium]|nr:GtrA family protein [Lachnospiraceae bacterium]